MFNTLFRKKVDEICTFMLVQVSQKEDKCLIMNKVNNQLFCVINPSSKNRIIIPLNGTYKEIIGEDPRRDLKEFKF